MIESGPKKLYVEPTMKCNLNCKMCVRNVLSEKIGNMSLETYKRLLDVFSDLSLLNLSGYGEPLLNKDIFTMIKLAKANLSEDATVACNTNATQISEKVAEKLVQSGIDKIVVSMDGAHPETFEKIRGWGKFLSSIKKRGEVEPSQGSVPKRDPATRIRIRCNEMQRERVAAIHGASGLIWGLIRRRVKSFAPHGDHEGSDIIRA